MTASLRLFTWICTVGLVAANSASAADLAGEWTLNIPVDPTTWTFTQKTPTTPQFTATTTVVQGPVTYQYDINPGFTLGPLVLGLETVSVQGGPVVPVGILIATVDADSLSGVLISFTGGTTEVAGQKVVARSAPKSRRR